MLPGNRTFPFASGFCMSSIACVLAQVPPPPEPGLHWPPVAWHCVPIQLALQLPQLFCCAHVELTGFQVSTQVLLVAPQRARPALDSSSRPVEEFHLKSVSGFQRRSSRPAATANAVITALVPPLFS